MSAADGGHVFHRFPRLGLPVARSGDGVHVVDATGRRYLDASGGAAVSCLGHSDPDVIQAIKDQLDRIPYAHTAFFTTDALEELADALVDAAPPGLSRAYFTSGGSEAIEAALKMARQYFVEIGQPQRRHFIARRQSYHGNTLGALAVGGNPARRASFMDILIETHHTSPCYYYRYRQEGESEDAMARRLAEELEAKILELGEGSVIAFVAETVVGATAGAVPPLPGYFKLIREVCDRHGVLLILDEVMCGMGRTGTLHACEQEGVRPDLIAFAKGLAAGYQPIGATLAAADIYQSFLDGSGSFQHGHTFMGHASAAAAALVVQRKLQRPETMAEVRRLGGLLDRCLNERFGNHRHVGDIRGRGLFRAIELVADRSTGASFDPETRLHARLKHEALARGLICYPGGGTIDGRNGDHVLLAPPFIVTDAQIGEIVETLGAALDAAVSDGPP